MGLETPLLHTKFQGNQSIGSEEEVFFKMILPYTGMVAIFVMWPNSYLLIFISLFRKAFPSYSVTNGPVVSDKNKF